VKPAAPETTGTAPAPVGPLARDRINQNTNKKSTMKKAIALLIALLGAANLPAQGTLPAYTVAVDFPFATKYVFRGIEVTKDCIQPSVTFTSGNFNASVWTSQPVTQNLDNEFDFVANYDLPLNKDWKTTLGATTYYYPELDGSTGGKRSTFEPKLSLTGPLGPVSSTWTAYYDLTLKNTTVEAVFGYSVPMQGSKKDTMDFGATVAHVAVDRGNDYDYCHLSAKATFRPKDNLTVYAGVIYASNNLNGAKDNLVYFTAGVTVAF
jgi:uncharacterized protein (TIGR02001 family)